MNLYYNLPPEQRRVQRLVTAFNKDEQLWESLEGKRRLRRKLFLWLSKKRKKQLDLLDFANTRPPEDCVGRTKGLLNWHAQPGKPSPSSLYFGSSPIGKGIMILLKNPYECFDELSMNGKIFNGFNSSSVRPEALEG
jgi:hypothetical protein